MTSLSHKEKESKSSALLEAARGKHNPNASSAFTQQETCMGETGFLDICHKVILSASKSYSSC